ncbi:hypothetical protein AWB81_07544 [Caballeronia arationis]|nr:hypothetical protein AWB81_07544 [Caballeronia arationis]
MAECKTEQGRNDDRPAENSNLTEAIPEGWLGFLTRLALALKSLPRGAGDAVTVGAIQIPTAAISVIGGRAIGVRPRHDVVSPSAEACEAAPGRR